VIRLCLLVILIAGCGSPNTVATRVPLLCECFSEAAYECIKAESRSVDEPEKCCGKCNGTGKVRSGDGLALVDCPCPPTCPCKAKK
jgi:hypothetical protein